MHLSNFNQKLIIMILAFTFAATSVFASTTNPVAKSGKLTGVWKLKQTSGKTTKKVKQQLIPTPESIVMYFEEGLDEITINEGFKEFIQTQTLPTTGAVINSSLQQIGKVSSKAFWQNGKLFLEVETSQGDKITEIFALSANQNQLFVTLQMTENNSAKSHKVKRIYQRVSETVEKDETQQVDLTIYPL